MLWTQQRASLLKSRLRVALFSEMHADHAVEHRDPDLGHLNRGQMLGSRSALGSERSPRRRCVLILSTAVALTQSTSTQQRRTVRLDTRLTDVSTAWCVQGKSCHTSTAGQHENLKKNFPQMCSQLFSPTQATLSANSLGDCNTRSAVDACKPQEAALLGPPFDPRGRLRMRFTSACYDWSSDDT